MTWPFGAEHWCNLEGTNLHIVSDMIHLAEQDYETSICSLGVFGTRYVRGGEPLPAEIKIAAGETWSFSLAHIYSEIEIGTKLEIAVREKTGSNTVTIVNKDSSAYITIDTTKAAASDARFVVVLESFNTLSNVQSALKTDIMVVNVIYVTPQFAAALSPFEAVAYRVAHKNLPEIKGSYPITLHFKPEKYYFSDYLSYDPRTNYINYRPKNANSNNDGYELSKFEGSSTIEIRLEDVMGYERKYKMKFSFIVPLKFKEELPSINVVAGEIASVRLPEVEVQDGYQLREINVKPKMRFPIYYDRSTNAIVYEPSPKNVFKEFDFEGDSLIYVKLLDTDMYEYKYEMNFSLRMPALYFSASSLPHFKITNGASSSYQLPKIVIANGFRLKDIVLEADDKDLELADYFEIRDNF